ncbi:MAG: hypothetical protein WBW33_30285 [Bryobacteraceae bacterium]
MFTVRGRFLLALPLFSVSLLFAADSDKPKLTGTWELDAAKSQLEHGPGALQVILQDVSGKIQFTRTIHTPEGKDLVAKFECLAGGPDCAFDEAGHKSKVSLWYQGAALVILKTDGPSDDEVTQWTLKLDNKTLQIEVSHITPAGKTETMVLNRKSGPGGPTT